MATGTKSNKVAITFGKKHFDWLNAYALARDCSFAEAVRVMVSKQIKQMEKTGWRVSTPSA